MSGGDNTWFWIVTSIDSRPSALWVQCNAVTILRFGTTDMRTFGPIGGQVHTELPGSSAMTDAITSCSKRITRNFLRLDEPMLPQKRCYGQL